jgi:hypothetical protein
MKCFFSLKNSKIANLKKSTYRFGSLQRPEGTLGIEKDLSPKETLVTKKRNFCHKKKGIFITKKKEHLSQNEM